MRIRPYRTYTLREKRAAAIERIEVSRLRRHERACRKEVKAARLQNEFRAREHGIRDRLSQANTLRELMQIFRETLESLQIGGVNVYRYNTGSGNLWSVEREALQGPSRYENQGTRILPGEKKHFIETGEERSYPATGADILLVDRCNLKGFSEENKAQALKDIESDLKKYFGENYEEQYAGRIGYLKEAIRWNLYVRFPGFSPYDAIIMANHHAENARRVREGMPPHPLLGDPAERALVFEILRDLQYSFTGELIKADLLRAIKNELNKAAVTHDLQMALDEIEDPKVLFEKLLSKLPEEFMRSENETYVEGASIMLFDEEVGALKTVSFSSSRPGKDEVVSQTTIGSGERIAWKVFSSGKPLLVLDAVSSGVFDHRGDSAKVAPGSFMSAPIKSPDRPYGVLNIRSRHPRAFKERDISHLETWASILASKMRLIELRIKDGLTKVLYQRAPFGEKRLKCMVGQSRSQDVPIAFLMLDLDRFKKINDTYGHAKGDEVLIGTAEVIHRFVLARRKEFKDHIEIRWGGEEFALVLLGVGPGRAQELAEELRQEIEKTTYTFYGEEKYFTASIGVATHGLTPEELSENADLALYVSKNGGRNTVSVYTPRDSLI